jgi:hypothetical protein
VEHARAEDHSHHEEYGNSGVQDVIYDSEHLCLAEGADESQGISDEIEFCNLGLCQYEILKLEKSFIPSWRMAADV